MVYNFHCVKRKVRKFGKMVNVITPISSQKWDVNSKESSRIKRSLTAKAKISIIIFLALLTLVVVVVVVCFLLPREDKPFWPSYVSQSKLGKYERAAISSDAAPCVSIGKDILQRNGSAVDAAIAILFCMGVHNPHSMGLGGGFLMLYYNRTKRAATFIDAREVAPLDATEDMFHANATMAAEGGLSIAVPGELAGYKHAHNQYGRLEWKELVQPTIEMCRQGIEVSPHLERAIKMTKEKLIEFGAIGDVFLKNGTDPYVAGERLKMPTLANTLEAIAKQGTKALYGRNNELAKKFREDLEKAGSIITEDDMALYSPFMREPLEVNLRKNTTLYGVLPPGSGPLLAFMMLVLDGYADMDESAKEDKDKAALAYHRIVETFKYAYSFRSLLEDKGDDDPGIDELTKKITSKEYVDEIRSRISDSKTYNDLSHYDFKWDFAEDHGTAHLSIVAPDGDAVSVTSTINQYFGSKILSPSTGIILNDEMDDFSSPNITNLFDVPPTPKNHIKPGRRPMSSMTPMILTDGDGNVKLVLGGNGGTMITTGVMQVAARSLFFGEDIKQCIDAPRIHHQLKPNVLHYEKDFPEVMVEKLRKFGHDVEEWNMGMMSIIMGVQRGEDGYLYANSDYRKGGDVGGF
nr:venom protein [Lampona murina]